MSTPLRALLAVHDAPTRAGITWALANDGIVVCADPIDARSTVAAAVRERPDVCIIDEDLPGGSIIAVDAICQRLDEAKIVLLTISDNPRSLLSAIRAGASGFVRKDLDPTRLPETLRGVVAGEAALSRRLTYRLMQSLRTRERGRAAPTTPGGPSMTDRELEVLELMAEGLRTSEIAVTLGISDVTVRRHASSAVSKLGVADRSAAISVLTGRSRA